MITKITKANQALYKSLFAKAEAELGLDTPITTLEEYFTGIKELVAADPVYAVLPLDEEPFEINADTREITIPASFKKAGLSVQGDEIAEVVYFSIDRFFDAQDLYNKDINIVIQWETVPKGGAAKRSGLSREFVRDITTLADDHKILFGWPITSEITKEAGQIKFAVRFYKTGVAADGVTPIMVYSMSTLPATAFVAAGLDADLTDAGVVIVDSTKDITNRFVNSETPSYHGKPNAPVYVLNMLADQSVVFEKDGEKCVDLVEGKREFKVEAVNDGDAGVITYSWFKKSTADGVPTNLGEGTTEYAATTDSAVVEGKTYYKLENEKYIPAVVAGDPSANEVTLYEKISKIDATSVGYYYANANTRVGFGNNSADSDVYKIPGPGEVTASGEGDGRLVEGKATLRVTAIPADAKDTLVYSWTVDGAEVGTGAAYEVTVANEDLAAYDKIYKATVKATRNGAESEVKEFEFRVVDGVAHAASIAPEFLSYIRRKNAAVLKATVDATTVVSDEIEYQLFKETYLAEDEEPNDRSNDEAVGDAITVTEKNFVASVTVADAGRYYFKVTNKVDNATPAISYSEVITVS